MDFNELILKRRSVRTYAPDKEISKELIEEIITASYQAPSWKNSQTARYYVACTPEAIEKVRKALPEFNNRSSENAALVITTFVKDISGFNGGVAEDELSNKWGAYDLGLNNAYFILAAKERGLDTLIMGLRDARLLREEFNIPKTEQITAVIALGYGAKQSSPRRDREIDGSAKFF
ncbi:MAG: nitroreductase family protein [Lachnospiraceae bacterium]|nr:nitroreductase family protein [Lachnospiraceae bacterium]